MRIKLSQYAKQNNVTYQTALKWYKKGLIENAIKLPSGSIFVDMIDDKKQDKLYIATYARVSNQSRKKELNYQIDRLNQFALAKGYSVTKSFKEVASGMNDSRRELWKMIDSKPDILIIENKDRLTRFGYKYIEKLLNNQGTKIICINESLTDEDDIMKDLISIITSFCCRIYGLRRGTNKIKQIKSTLNDNI